MLRFLGLVAVGALLAGCSTTAERVGQGDNFLMMAGFTKVERNNPLFSYVAHAVPANRFGHSSASGVTEYFYFDPTICGCAYVGTEQNWAEYKQLARDRMQMDANSFLERANMPSDTGSG